MEAEFPPNVLPDSAVKLFAMFRAAGFECYAVGGCVRDSLRGQTPTDWDFTTDATVACMKAVFDDAGLHWLPTGEAHGTLTVFVDDQPFEVTTYRVDGPYSDGRHPDSVRFTRSLEEDLARRDFTVNAMAYNPERGLVDCFGGREDLAAGLIRTVGDPDKRFSEDGLRVLRGLRFAATLDFTLEAETAQALHRCADMLTPIAKERIYAELSKMLLASDGGHLASLLGAYGDVLDVCFGVADHQWVTTLLAYLPPRTVVRWAGLVRSFEPSDAAAHLRALRCPHDLVSAVERLLRLSSMQPEPSRSGVRKLLAACGSEEVFRDLVTFWKAETHAGCEALNEGGLSAPDIQTLADLEALAANEFGTMVYSVHDLAIRGGDLIALGVSPGPAVGRCLDELFQAVVALDLPNEHEALLDAARASLQTS